MCPPFAPGSVCPALASPIVPVTDAQRAPEPHGGALVVGEAEEGKGEREDLARMRDGCLAD